MRHPSSLTSLVEQGIIQEIVRPLMSGKEAQVYLVVSGGELRVAKVYKEAQDRTFKHRAEYTEGRAVRNTRTQRAISKHSRFGRVQDEAAWRSAEVDIIHRLRDAGVRVPEPYHFVDGVLVMELIHDASGQPAPRLADVELSPEEATATFELLLGEVVKMLCAAVIHGDLSDFNVLMGHAGPVLIDFPQAVDPAQNQNARKLLVRDVDNLTRFFGRSAPGRPVLPYGEELWDLYARSQLTPETRLTGCYQPPRKKANTRAVLVEIEAAARDEQRRRDAQGPSRRKARQPKHGPDQAANATSRPGAAANATSRPGAAANATSRRGAAASATPRPGAAASATPRPGAAASATPRPGAAANATPRPGAAASATPRPGAAASATPRPGASANATPARPPAQAKSSGPPPRRRRRRRRSGAGGQDKGLQGS